MTSVYNVYLNDKEYQKIVGSYFDTVNVLKKGFDQGLIKHDSVDVQKMHDELESKISKWNENKLAALSHEREEIKASYEVELDYTTPKAKYIEVKYNLMENQELQDAVNELNTDSLLQINLLRLELKSRNMKAELQQVKSYITQNKLEKSYEDDERYNEISKEIGVISMVGSRGIIEIDQYNTLDNVTQDFNKVVQDAKVNPKQATKDLPTLMKQTRDLEEQLRAVSN